MLTELLLMLGIGTCVLTAPCSLRNCLPRASRQETRVENVYLIPKNLFWDMLHDDTKKSIENIENEAIRLIKDEYNFNCYISIYPILDSSGVFKMKLDIIGKNLNLNKKQHKKVMLVVSDLLVKNFLKDDKFKQFFESKFPEIYCTFFNFRV